MTVTIRAREAFYIKREDLTPKVRSKLARKYTHRFYEERVCENQCEFYGDRMATKDKHLDVCDNCAAYKGGAALMQDVKLNSTRYVTTPMGDKDGLTKILEAANIDWYIKRLHPEEEMSRKIKFIGELRDYQKDAVKAIRKKKRGVIKAPPRSGKTVLSTASICELGLKTLIIASQHEWLMGFKETFIGSKTQKPMTNCKKSQIGIAKKLADFQKYDICLVTVQTFWSEKGQKLLRKIRDMFGVAFIDEIHTGAAPKYATAISQLNVKYLIGLSGTPSRKDGRFAIMRDLIGQNIYEAKVERLRPRIHLVRTGYSRNAKNVAWTSMVTHLEKDPKRLKLIAQWALKDVENGHMVLIPFMRVTPIKALVKAINLMAGEDIARPFYGGLGKNSRGEKLRDVYIQKARKYKVKVLVGNAKLLSTGTNIPRASMLYDVTPSNNLENCEQRTSRVLTPWDDKPPPGVRYFLDELDARKRCMSNEWFRCVKKLFRPVITDKDDEILRNWFRSKSGPSYRTGRVEL